MARVRHPKRGPNKNRAPKKVRMVRRYAAAMSRTLNPLRWAGLVPKSVALMDHCKARNYGG